MTGLFHAHSGLRFLVLLAAVAALVVCGLGLMQKKPFTKVARILCSSFVGLLHLQVLIGLAMVFMGTWYPRLIGHLAMMLTATVLAQVLLTVNKRSATPGYRLPLLAVGGALLLIIGGILAIGRHPLVPTPFTGG